MMITMKMMSNDDFNNDDDDNDHDDDDDDDDSNDAYSLDKHVVYCTYLKVGQVIPDGLRQVRRRNTYNNDTQYSTIHQSW